MAKEIFALDIGTRKVMGIIARQQDECVEIVDVEVREHAARPMFDGQIHSIEEVVKTVVKIKESLEGRLGRKLTQVGVAVAGRNLATYKSNVSKDLGTEQEITQDMVRDLELEAIDAIISNSGNKLSEFYCVGYSPIYYELDNNRIAVLRGHRGKIVRVEVIATFLPRVVLDSMFSVLEKAGLEAVNMTLEPISALNAIVPSEMRNLNIVLVDIGAGTSDLALTKDGFIFAYGMVPEAGDEITEYISKILLVDFSTAERIKRSLDKEVMITYEDIWGKPQRIDIFSLKKSLLPAVKKLAASIAQAGLALNEGAPEAVIIVGGGSQTPDLIQELAKGFGVAPQKVGIRLPQMIKSIDDLTGTLRGPETITPIGITLMTMQSSGLCFIHVTVNGRLLRMLDFQQKKDILAVLTASGAITDKKLFPRPGLSLTAEVNGELRIFKGSLGRSATVSLNGKPVNSLSDKVEDGDTLLFVEAVDGVDGSVCLRDAVGHLEIPVMLNRQQVMFVVPVLVNGSRIGWETMVPDRAVIQRSVPRIRDLLEAQGIDMGTLSERQILVNVNEAPRMLTQCNFTLRLNGQLTGLDAELQGNDFLEFNADTPTYYRIKDIIDLPKMHDTIHVIVDGKDIDMVFEAVQVFMNGQQVKLDEFLIDGADIKVYYVKKRQILLSDIFKYIDFDPYKGFGKKIKILVNDSPAGFVTPLTEGAQVQILFEDRL
ncbi:MAG: cell division FtsA domain-containing protein [Candidatus Omnitrophota bacterium]|jgi:cell division protein FtsA